MVQIIYINKLADRDSEKISRFPASDRTWEQDLLYAINWIQNAEHGTLAVRAAQASRD
jgi:hypothetical protein